MTRGKRVIVVAAIGAALAIGIGERGEADADGDPNTAWRGGRF
jgi:hypothetical protein